MSAPTDGQKLSLHGPDGPYNGMFAITPADATDLSIIPMAVYIGGSGTNGDLTVVTREGDTVAFTGLLAGRVYRIRPVQVHSTGTDVTGIVGLY